MAFADTKYTILFTMLAFILCSCSQHDSEYIPYGLTGMNTYVSDNVSGTSYLTATVSGKYSERENLVNSCQSIASNFAIEREFEDWSYICCTITKDSDCFTKVK